VQSTFTGNFLILELRPSSVPALAQHVAMELVVNVFVNVDDKLLKKRLLFD